MLSVPVPQSCMRNTVAKIKVFNAFCEGRRVWCRGGLQLYATVTNATVPSQLQVSTGTPFLLLLDVMHSSFEWPL